jgi:hypothetical protein
VVIDRAYSRERLKIAHVNAGSIRQKGKCTMEETKTIVTFSIEIEILEDRAVPGVLAAATVTSTGSSDAYVMHSTRRSSR